MTARISQGAIHALRGTIERCQGLGLDFESAARLLYLLDDPSVMEYNPSDDNGLPSIPGYVIEARLGGGAGGHVYLARREGQEAKLAVKVLHRSLGEGGSSRRVWRELDLLAQTRLPCLPRVIDSFEHDGRLCVVTEYIEGRPLDAYCDENGLDRRARAELLARVCRAAQSLHERGIIHRDLKPSNVLVTSSGDVFIIDLGIAMLEETDAFTTLTHDGAPVGSPAFMSPEQASGERERVSTRSDVYALGAIGYLLLTGETPHNMNSTLPSALRRVSEEPARDPRALDNTLTVGLASVLQKSVARKPEERYATSSDLAEEFERWLRGEPVTARPMGVWQRTVRLDGASPDRDDVGGVSRDHRSQRCADAVIDLVVEQPTGHSCVAFGRRPGAACHGSWSRIAPLAAWR